MAGSEDVADVAAEVETIDLLDGEEDTDLLGQLLMWISFEATRLAGKRVVLGEPSARVGGGPGGWGSCRLHW